MVQPPPPPPQQQGVKNEQAKNECQIANFWPKTTNLTSKLIYFQFPDDLNRFRDGAMYIHRYIHRYIHTYSLWSKYCQIPNFWPKTASLTSKFIKIKFPDDLNRFEGHTMYTYRYIGTYIDTYIHIYVMLYDGKSCQIVNFWRKTTNLTSKLIYI